MKTAALDSLLALVLAGAASLALASGPSPCGSLTGLRARLAEAWTLFWGDARPAGPARGQPSTVSRFELK